MTGWAEGTEVEFIIDAGCQMTILATSVFERMCATDPQFTTVSTTIGFGRFFLFAGLGITRHDYCVPGIALQNGVSCC